MYYYIPPDSVALTPPLVPKRVSRSYENCQPKEAVTTEVRARPLVPPKKGYENVELTDKSVQGSSATSPGLNPPVPARRTRAPRTPPRELESCPVTPPPSRKGRDKVTPERSKLFKTTSYPYCPVSPDSPVLPAKLTTKSRPHLPTKSEGDDSTKSDQPSPYYSLPPDFSPADNFDLALSDSSEEGSGKLDEEEGHETYLMLDEDVDTTKKQDAEQQLSLLTRPPIPPKVCHWLSSVLTSALSAEPPTHPPPLHSPTTTPHPTPHLPPPCLPYYIFQRRYIYAKEKV